MKDWKILICDDDETIHQLSDFVLARIRFMDRGVELLHAFNSDECLESLKENPDTALLMLDMIMEEDDSGIKVLKRIREELKNPLVRVVLRSGHSDPDLPKELFEVYDLSDYKEKTQLTSKGSDRMIYSALRAYYNITSKEKDKKEKVIPS